MACREAAPEITDCLTSIHYIFKQALKVDIPLTFVGDMPRRLLTLDQWEFCEIDPKEACCGDLVFAKRIREEKLIAHVALLLGPDEVFHCKRDGGPIVESFEKFCSLFEQKLTLDQLRYIDPRNREMREKYKDKFIPKEHLP